MLSIIIIDLFLERKQYHTSFPDQTDGVSEREGREGGRRKEGRKREREREREREEEWEVDTL